MRGGVNIGLMEKLASVAGHLHPTLAYGYRHQGPPPADAALIWPQAGFAAFRPPAEVGLQTHLFFTAGYHSYVHKHMDDLSFTLFAFGQRFIDEVGADYKLSSSSKEYKLLRTAAGHNTIVCKQQPWTTGQYETTRITGYFSSSGVWALRGEQHRMKGVRVVRSLILVGPDVLFVLDDVQTSGCQVFSQLFHFAPALEASRCSAGVRLEDNTTGFCGWVLALDASEELELTRGPDGWPPAFELRAERVVPAWATSFSKPVGREGRFPKLITFAKDGRPPVTAARIAGEGSELEIGFQRAGRTVRHQITFRPVSDQLIIRLR